MLPPIISRRKDIYGSFELLAKIMHVGTQTRSRRISMALPTPKPGLSSGLKGSNTMEEVYVPNFPEVHPDASSEASKEYKSAITERKHLGTYLALVLGLKLETYVPSKYILAELYHQPCALPI